MTFSWQDTCWGVGSPLSPPEITSLEAECMLAKAATGPELWKLLQSCAKHKS